MQDIVRKYGKNEKKGMNNCQGNNFIIGNRQWDTNLTVRKLCET